MRRRLFTFSGVIVICLVLVYCQGCGGGSKSGGKSSTPAGTGNGTGTGTGTASITAESFSLIAHLDLTMTESEKSAFEDRVRQAGQCLWEATEGQMYFPDVTIGYGYGIVGCHWYITKKGMETGGHPGLKTVPPGVLGWYTPDYTSPGTARTNERFGTGTEFLIPVFVHEFSHFKLQYPNAWEAYDCVVDSGACVRAGTNLTTPQDRYLFCDDSNSVGCKSACSQGSSWSHILSFKTGWKHPNTFDNNAPQMNITTK